MPREDSITASAFPPPIELRTVLRGKHLVTYARRNGNWYLVKVHYDPRHRTPRPCWVVSYPAEEVCRG